MLTEGCVRMQGYMWRAFAAFESREGDALIARHYFARAVNAEVTSRVHICRLPCACLTPVPPEAHGDG